MNTSGRVATVGLVVIVVLALGWLLMSHFVMGTGISDALGEALGVALGLLIVGSVLGAIFGRNRPS